MSKKNGLKITRQFTMGATERFDSDIATIRRRYSKSSDTDAVRYAVGVLAHLAKLQGEGFDALRIAQLGEDGSVKANLVIL